MVLTSNRLHPWPQGLPGIITGLILLLAALVPAGLGARENVLEAIRDATHRKPRVNGIIPSGRMHPKNADYAIATGYLFDIGLGVLFHTMFAEEGPPPRRARSLLLEANLPAGRAGGFLDARDPTDLTHGTWFLPYPYAQGYFGYVFQPFDARIAPPSRNRNSGNSASARLIRSLRQDVYLVTTDETYDFAHRLNTARATLRFDGLGRTGLDTSWAYLHESLANQATSELGLTDANIVLCWMAFPAVRVRSGFGGNYMQDGVNSTRGFNLTNLVDIFPADPVAVHVEVDVGTLGTALLVHTRVTAGIFLNRFEFTAGYDYLQIETVAIRGPAVGLSLYF